MARTRWIHASWVIVLLVAGLAGILLSPAAAKPSLPEPVAGVDYVDGRVLVKFSPGAPASARSRAHAAAGGRVSGGIPALGVSIVDVGSGRALDAIAAYSKNPNVLYAEVDGIVRPTLACTENAGTISNDDCSWRQWGLHNTGAPYREAAAGTADADVDVPEAWATGASGAGVIIAVLDTGYDFSHEDVASRVTASADFTGDGVADLHGHGTWTASIAGASTNNGLGIGGVAPGSTLIVGKVLNNAGSGSWSQVANGITWAANYSPASRTIISMSLGGACRGGPFGCSTLENAVNYAASNGALLVAAAGNSGGSTEYPGAFANVLAIAATDANDAIASFSSVGNVAAPGVDILGAFPDCKNGETFALAKACEYDYGNGTSASAPIASGVAALVWSSQPGLTASGVRAALVNTATNIPGSSYDGAGRISACAALNLAGTSCGSGGVDPTPTTEPTNTPTPTDTPTPTNTPEPEDTPTPDPTPSTGTVITLTSSKTSTGSTWTASVTVSVTVDGQPANEVNVVGSWSSGGAGSGNCTTSSGGSCTVTRTGIPKRVGSVTYTVGTVGGVTVSGASTTVTKP